MNSLICIFFHCPVSLFHGLWKGFTLEYTTKGDNLVCFVCITQFCHKINPFRPISTHQRIELHEQIEISLNLSAYSLVAGWKLYTLQGVDSLWEKQPFYRWSAREYPKVNRMQETKPKPALLSYCMLWFLEIVIGSRFSFQLKMKRVSFCSSLFWTFISINLPYRIFTE